MNRRLLLLNVVLVFLSALFVAALVRELLTSRPLPPMATQNLAPSATATASEAPGAPPIGSGAYLVIANKNLFSPSRTEGPSTSVDAAAPKPLLHGVVMDGKRSRAYLEDPNAKKIYGYAIGDAVAGGRVQSITGDRVIIARPDGRMEVLLQDPDKPKPEPLTPGGATPQQPGTPQQSGTPQQPAPPQQPASAPQPTMAPTPAVAPSVPVPTAPAPGRTSRRSLHESATGTR